MADSLTVIDALPRATAKKHSPGARQVEKPPAEKRSVVERGVRLAENPVPVAHLVAAGFPAAEDYSAAPNSVNPNWAGRQPAVAVWRFLGRCFA